jgi:hypothetical protein
LNALLEIIWLLRDALDLVLDRLWIHPVKNFFGLLRRTIHDGNTFNQMLKATANMSLMNEWIENLSNERNPDVRRIPTCMNMADVKFRGAQMEEEDLSWWKIRIEGPKAMVVVCLRAFRHSTDICQTNILKFNEFSEYIAQLAGSDRMSNLANEWSHTFAATSGSRIMDMNITHSAKAQCATPK